MNHHRYPLDHWIDLRDRAQWFREERALARWFEPWLFVSPEEQREAIRRLYLAGWTPKQIARRYHVTAAAIVARLKRLGVYRPPPVEDRSDRNAEMAAMRARGATFAEIGRAFGISASRAADIIHRIQKRKGA